MANNTRLVPVNVLYIVWRGSAGAQGINRPIAIGYTIALDNRSYTYGYIFVV